MVKPVIILLTLTSNLPGQVTLSEVLSNEPAGRVRLEWIEIYNRDSLDIDLNGYLIISDLDTTLFAPGTVIPARSFAVIARQPLPVDGSDSFEAYWGDSSGVWGDYEFENYLLVEGNIRLNNISGSVTLADVSGPALDQFNWNTPSDDARSAEKDNLDRDFSSWHACFDASGSTPGRANSEIPSSGPDAFTLEIEPRAVSSNAFVSFDISALVPSGSKLSIEIYDDSGLKRRTLLRDEESAVVNAGWNGLDDSNRSLPPGVYIVVASLSGRRSDHRQIPVVIAP